MKHPFTIHIQQAYPDATLNQYRVPAWAEHRMEYADRALHWSHRHFQLTFQDMDSDRVYIACMESFTEKEIQIPISCHTHDIYWIFQQKGSSQLLSEEIMGETAELCQLKAGQHLILFGPPGKYHIRLAKNKNEIIFFILKADWMDRYREGRLKLLKEKLHYLSQKRVTCKIGKAHLTSLPMTMQLQKLMAIQGYKEYELDSHLEIPITSMVNLHLDLRKHNKLYMASPEERLAAIRTHATKMIEKGVFLNVEMLADYFGYTRQSINRLHRQYYRISIQEYVVCQKMGHALILICSKGWSPTQTAMYLQYREYASFSRQFKKIYGISPSDAKTSASLPIAQHPCIPL